MQAAIREWLNLYYGTQSPGEDAADRLAVLVVSKLCRTVFAEYESRTAEALAPSLQALDAVRVQAMQYALVGGECLLKPVLHGRGFDFVPIRRDCYAPLGRDAHGALTGRGHHGGAAPRWPRLPAAGAPHRRGGRPDHRDPLV